MQRCLDIPPVCAERLTIGRARLEAAGAFRRPVLVPLLARVVFLFNSGVSFGFATVQLAVLFYLSAKSSGKSLWFAGVAVLAAFAALTVFGWVLDRSGFLRRYTREMNRRNEMLQDIAAGDGKNGNDASYANLRVH